MHLNQTLNPILSIRVWSLLAILCSVGEPTFATVPVLATASLHYYDIVRPVEAARRTFLLDRAPLQDPPPPPPPGAESPDLMAARVPAQHCRSGYAALTRPPWSLMEIG